MGGHVPLRAALNSINPIMNPVGSVPAPPTPSFRKKQPRKFPGRTPPSKSALSALREKAEQAMAEMALKEKEAASGTAAAPPPPRVEKV